MSYDSNNFEHPPASPAKKCDNWKSFLVTNDIFVLNANEFRFFEGGFYEEEFGRLTFRGNFNYWELLFAIISIFRKNGYIHPLLPQIRYFDDRQLTLQKTPSYVNGRIEIVQMHSIIFRCKGQSERILLPPKRTELYREAKAILLGEKQADWERQGFKNPLDWFRFTVLADWVSRNISSREHVVQSVVRSFMNVNPIAFKSYGEYLRHTLRGFRFREDSLLYRSPQGETREIIVDEYTLNQWMLAFLEATGGGMEVLSQEQTVYLPEPRPLDEDDILSDWK